VAICHILVVIDGGVDGEKDVFDSKHFINITKLTISKT
jgi:hypothetical protein